jgi:dTDP-4-dehydrorhamnose reductase
MRILLTGASGQVGGALLPLLQAHQVVAPREIEFDLARTLQIAEMLDRFSPELIINPAAYTSVDRAEQERDRAYLVNATAPATIARWAAERDVPLLHFSTDYVFSGGENRPWRENDLANPLSVYGASKLAGDNAVRAARGVALILRTSWVYAAEGRNFLRTIARLARERKQLRIVADQIGAPTSAALIAEIVSGMLADGLDTFRERCKRADGLVHLAASGETSWYDFACAIVEGLKVRGVTLTVERIEPITTNDYPTPARRPHNSRLDLSRLKKVFGVTPRSWSDALGAELDVLVRLLAKPSPNPADQVG